MPSPLPLVPFEEYMLADDRPAYPMSFFIRLRFAGRLERAALAWALGIAVERHPLLCATVDEDGPEGLQWSWAGRGTADLHWLTTFSPNGLPHSPGIDLRKEPGLRLTAIEAGPCTELVAQFHHACCDGLGAMVFLEDLLTAYALRIGAALPHAAPRQLECERLPERASFGLTAWKYLKIQHRQFQGPFGAWDFFAHTPVPIVPHRPRSAAEAPPAAYPAALTHEFQAEESALLRQSARQQGVTLNDLLARDLFLALGAWKARHAPAAPCDRLRLSIPVNLRGRDDGRLPAANVVSMVFLDRRPKDFADAEGLLWGIHRQMEHIKQTGLGLTFVMSLRAIQALPGGIARLTADDRCSATGVLTNFGILLADVPLPRLDDGRLLLGDAVLEGLDVVAPLRPYTCAAAALFTYAGRLGVTLHYDPRPLSGPQAGDLLGTYVERVCDSLPKAEEVVGYASA